MSLRHTPVVAASPPQTFDDMIAVRFTDTDAWVTYDIPSPFAPPVKHTVHIAIVGQDWQDILNTMQGAVQKMYDLTHDKAVEEALHLTTGVASRPVAATTPDASPDGIIL